LFEIHDPKRRTIAAGPFRDRVVHHALCNLLAPVLERRFIGRSYSCQLGKGTTAARECCRQLANRHAYVLKCDVSKFFPNIDHELLFAKLKEWVACPGARELIRRLLGSCRTGPEVAPPLFPGDDFTAVGDRPRGLGATKRRFERRRSALLAHGDLGRLGASVFAWYRFSREGNTAGLRRAYARWPLGARLRCRRRKMARVLRDGSRDYHDPDSGRH
jgi:hypothetical protein